MWEKELAVAIEVAKEAKDIILNIYKTNFAVETKSDGSPVTLADKKADKLIREKLKAAFPTYGFLTEEAKDDIARLSNDYVWIVDPLDGTTNFVDKTDGFTINIALAYKHEVVLGVIMIPLANEIYYATDSNGAFLLINNQTKKIHVSDRRDHLRVLLSKSHHNKKVDDVLNNYKGLIESKTYVGAAIKACMIARGDAELSIGLSDKTKEWDTAACQILIKEAGGVYCEPNGSWIKYNRKDTVNHNGYVMANNKDNILI